MTRKNYKRSTAEALQPRKSISGSPTHRVRLRQLNLTNSLLYLLAGKTQDTPHASPSPSTLITSSWPAIHLANSP